MDALQSRHLFDLTLEVAFDRMLEIGKVAVGRRRVAPINGGTFKGERLSGVVLPGGADWVVNRADGAMLVDVRITLETDDMALIFMAYTGSFRAGPEEMRRFNRGELLAPHEYALRTVPRFETGAERYGWLNDLIAIGVGRQTTKGPCYTVHEIV